MLKKQVDLYEREAEVSRKESELIINEAKLNAEKIVNEAESKANRIILKKEILEKELKEIIQTEKELIKRYEDKK
jgi:cell division septum initiation protein DivIVA